MRGQDAVLKREVRAGLVGGGRARVARPFMNGKRGTSGSAGVRFSPVTLARKSFSNICNFWFQMFRMFLFLLLLWFLPPAEGSTRAEPMFTAVTNSVLPPDYDSNPTQLNYGVAVTDVDHDGDFEIVVAG